MKKLLLWLMVFAVVLSACGRAVQDDVLPQEVEAPLEASANGGDSVDSAELPEPEPEAEPEPPPLCPENWPAHFAALVEEMANNHNGIIMNQDIIIMSFHLMDITLNGVPELLVHVATEAPWGPAHIALGWDFPVSRIEGLMRSDAAYSGVPLRFFQSEDTEDVIYSSMIFDHLSRGIAYRFVNGLTPYKVVWCNGYGLHSLFDWIDFDGPVWTGGLIRADWNLIEEVDIGFEYNPDPNSPPFCNCGVWYGRNSPDPTIVHLVNLALEGFTEISAPPIYTFDDLGWMEEIRELITVTERVKEIQQWIFEVAQTWNN